MYEPRKRRNGNPSVEPGRDVLRDPRLDRSEASGLSRAIFRPEIPHAPAPALLDIRLPAEKARKDDICPRCQARLAERFGFGWCQRCGYCRYMQQRSPISDELDAGEYHPAFFVVPHWPGLLPQWAGVLLCGWMVCAVASFAAWHNVNQDPQARYAWCVAQASVGATMLIAAHVSAFLTIVPPSKRGRHAILFLSPRLWWAAWRRLPETRGPVWLVGWGSSIILGAGILYAFFEGMTLGTIRLPF